jgi:hypothetical protein
MEVFQLPSPRTVTWEQPFSEPGRTVLPGWVRADFGRFEFRWKIGPEAKARLTTLEPAGSGELPPLEKELWPLVLDGGSTALFLEWLPLLGVKAPTTLRLVVVVPTGELFSVLPGTELPPAAGLRGKPATLRWAEAVGENAVRYVQATCTGGSGRLELYWRREAGRPPALAGRAAEAASAGEIRLVPWMDEASGLAVLFRQVQPLEGSPPHLLALALVRTEELLQGFRQLF